jgi:hypothetical protein
MMNIKAFGVLLAISSLLAGCAGLRVSNLGNVDSSTNEPKRIDLPGIPIRVKEPVWVQETKILETGWQLQFTVKKLGAKNDVFQIPEGGPLVITCASPNAINMRVSDILNAIDKSANEDTIRTELRKQLPTIIQLDKDKDNVDCRKTVANVLKQESRLSGKEYYVTNVIPLFGSGSGTFKFASDGTLTEATTEATDETAKTLLGLFPIKERLTMQWGIDKKADAQALILTPGKPVTPLFSVEAALTAQKQLSTLRADLPETVDATKALKRPKLPPPLSLAVVETGGAELISVESADAPSPAKPDTKSFKISGSITPPEPEK